jgi:hypothetical protein
MDLVLSAMNAKAREPSQNGPNPGPGADCVCFIYSRTADDSQARRLLTELYIDRNLNFPELHSSTVPNEFHRDLWRARYGV